MAKRKRPSSKKSDETLVDLVEARDSAQDFIDRNGNLIFGVLTGIVLIVGGIFAYNNFIKKPKQQEAIQQMWKAEQQFFQDSFALALANPGGGYDGFNTLIDEYGGVASGNAANYYAGVSYLQLGQYEAAISYLEDVKAKGTILPIMKYGALGDAYSELGSFDKALSNYKKAAGADENEALTPIYLLRLGLLNEKLGNTSQAKDAYTKLTKQYPTSSMAKEAEKYLIRLDAVAG